LSVADREGSVPASLRSAAALVFVADLDTLELEAGDAHHLTTVLRVSASETVIAADGRGGWRTCVLGLIGDAGRIPGDGRGARRRGGRSPGSGPAPALLRPTGPVTVVAPPASPLTIGFAITKGDRTEWTVQKLTELGVDRIWPLITARTVVRLGPGEAGRRAGRLRRVAREAAAQSRRPRLPELREPTLFAEAISELGSAPGVLLAEPGGGPLRDPTTTVLVGPEGGWAPDELACGLERVNLGPSVLRAETAAVAAATLLTAVRGGIVRSP
jgi:16S rRNA (uracil1498-N3)-methyltransferase